MNPTSIIELLLTTLTTEGKLLGVRELWQRDEDNHDRIQAMIGEGLIEQWPPEFLYVTPKGLAAAPEPLCEFIVRWVDDVTPKLAEADQAKPDSDWTVRELSAHCGVPELQMRVALLYHGCVFRDLRGLSQIDSATGLPNSVGLSFSIRLKRPSLASIVEGQNRVLENGHDRLQPEQHERADNPEVLAPPLPRVKPNLREEQELDKNKRGDGGKAKHEVRQLDVRYFVVGCVLAAFVAVIVLWAFSRAHLSEDQRTLLRVLLPLAAGFSAGAFSGAFTIKARGLLPGVVTTGTGGFGVFVLLFILFPTGAGSSFGIVIRPHGPKGPTDVVCTQGTVTLDLLGDRRVEYISAKGEARFEGIPSAISGRMIPLQVGCPGFEMANPRETVLVSPAEPLYVPMVRKRDTGDQSPTFIRETVDAPVLDARAKDRTPDIFIPEPNLALGRGEQTSSPEIKSSRQQEGPLRQGGGSLNDTAHAALLAQPAASPPLPATDKPQNCVFYLRSLKISKNPEYKIQLLVSVNNSTHTLPKNSPSFEEAPSPYSAKFVIPCQETYRVIFGWRLFPRAGGPPMQAGENDWKTVKLYEIVHHKLPWFPELTYEVINDS